jgi:hypothetical protein
MGMMIIKKKRWRMAKLNIKLLSDNNEVLDDIQDPTKTVHRIYELVNMIAKVMIDEKVERLTIVIDDKDTEAFMKELNDINSKDMTHKKPKLKMQ